VGWFSRKPDPVDDLCRLLVERPWEWSGWKPDRDGGSIAYLRHVSGVALSWHNDRYIPTAWVSVGGQWAAVSESQARRLIAAVVAAAVERAKDGELAYAREVSS
jgi:hypothetical protein